MGSMFIICTDNMVSYYILQSGSSRNSSLHELVIRIQLQLIHLQIDLIIIWIPGSLMILEGSDGLSRGLWITPCKNGILSSAYIPKHFRAAPHGKDIFDWIVHISGCPDTPRWVNHMRPLHHKIIIGTCTFFTPPPHVARQVINAALSYWVEAPQRTSIFFLIPGILQHEWGRVNKYINVLGVFPSDTLPFFNTLHSTIYLNFLSLPNYIPAVTHRLDSTTEPTPDNWHVRQAEHVRGLFEPNFTPDETFTMSFCD